MTDEQACRQIALRNVIVENVMFALTGAKQERELVLVLRFSPDQIVFLRFSTTKRLVAGAVRQRSSFLM